MAASKLLRRGMLYIPTSSSKMLAKSQNLKVDTAVYDLEDSVAPNQKVEARYALRKFLQSGRPPGVKEVAVRINAIDTGLALDDLRAVLQSPNVDTIMVPKVESAADLTFVVDVLNSVQASAQVSEKPAFKILPLIESAKGLLNLNEICRASPYVSGLVFAAEDFCHDLGITRTAQLTELLFARSAVVTAVRAHRLTSAIDLVTTSFKNEAGAQQLEHECAQGRRLGFNGKQLIHPAQIDAAQRLFSPSVKDLQWAVRIVIADEKADAHGRGAWTLDGKMVDVPVVRRAQAIVANAEACEMDVQSLKDEWEDQQPE